MTKKDTMCEQCTPAKRIVGANPEVNNSSIEWKTFKKSHLKARHLQFFNPPKLYNYIDDLATLSLIIDVFPQGCRTALICHLAIQHEELKEVRWWCFQNTEETQIEKSIKRAGSLSLWIYLRGWKICNISYNYRWWAKILSCLPLCLRTSMVFR